MNIISHYSVCIKNKNTIPHCKQATIGFTIYNNETIDYINSKI